jgi:hypothetical protein
MGRLANRPAPVGRRDRPFHRGKNMHSRIFWRPTEFFAPQVVALEEEWGDWLVNQRQLDSAIAHFIESGNAGKAIEAAMAARQWPRAVQIVEAQDAKVNALRGSFFVFYVLRVMKA